MAVHRYLLRADVRARWRSLALLTVLVTVVVAAVLTSLAAARRTESSFERYVDHVRPFDAVVTSSSPDVRAQDLSGIEDIDGVAAAVGFRWYAAFPGDMSYQFFPMAVPDDDRIPETYLRSPVVEGRRPDPSAPLEVALSERSARTLGVGVGDPLPMTTLTDEQVREGGAFTDPAQGSLMELEVVGVVRTPADVASRDVDLEINYLTPAFAEEYGGDEVGLFIVGSLVMFEPGASEEAVSDRIEGALPVDIDTFFGADTLRRQAAPTLDAMATGLRIVALVITLVGGTVIALSLTRDAAERLGEHGALSALGLEGRGLLVQLGLASALAALIGVVLGGLLSVLLVPRALWGLARRAELRPELRVDASMLVASMAIAAVVLLLLVAIVTTAVLRRERRELAEGGRPSSVASRAAGLGAPLSVVAGLRLAFERGRGGRTIPVTAAAVAAGLGGLGVVAALVFSSSLQHAVTTPGVYGWDFDVVLDREDDDPPPPEAEEAAARMAEDPAFSAIAEYVLEFDVEVGGAPERAVFLDDVTGHTPVVVARGHEPRHADEVAIGATTLAEEGLHLGDRVAVARQGRKRDLEIVGVAVLPVNEDGGLGSEGLALHRETAEALGFDGTCARDETCSRGFAVTVAGGHDVQAAVDPYLAAGYTMVEPAPPSEVVRLTAIDRLPRVVAVFLGVISVITLAHAAAVTVRRRRRDLAVLRVLGFSRRDLRNAVRVQVAVLSVLGAVLGMVLGLALGRLLWRSVASSVSLPTVITLPALAIVSVPLMIALLAQLGATVPRRAAGRVPAGVVLRSE